MKKIHSKIRGVEIVELQFFDDHRGWLCELFRQDEIEDNTFPVMSYLSMTKPGVCRGPHEHKYQTDYICFLGQSEFKIYLWDNRTGSSNPERFVYNAGTGKIIRFKIPPGVVHAYKNVGTIDGLIINAPDKLYAGKGKGEPIDEIRHENSGDQKFLLDD